MKCVYCGENSDYVLNGKSICFEHLDSQFKDYIRKVKERSKNG